MGKPAKAELAWSPGSRFAPSAQYKPRDATSTVLHEVVRDHMEQFLLEASRGSDDGPGIPRFVEDELRKFLKCGDLAGGFARFKCGSCGKERLVPFSCKCRGACPSCAGRRMAERAADLVDLVIPYAPVRQWVLSLPFVLRYRLAWDHGLTRKVLRAFIKEIERFFRKQARAAGLKDVRVGAVAVIQRAGGALNLNVHFHVAVLDGGFFRKADGSLRFFAVRVATDDELKEIARRVREKVLKILGQKKLSPDEDAECWVDPLAEEHPAYAATCAASVNQLTAIGPRAGRRTMRLGVEPDGDEPPFERNGHHANAHGFDVHVGAQIHANDRARLERMLRYLLRPPIAQGRLSLLSDGKVALELKNQWNDGTTHLIFEPVEFIEKIAALVPRPQSNLIIYNGVLAPNAKWRKDVVRYGRPVLVKPASEEQPEPEKPAEGSRYRPWAELMKRTFGLDVLCCTECGGRMKLIALIEEPSVVRKILKHLKLPTDLATPLPARSPPEQLELYDTYAE
ncbi:MAG: transposase [Deltaproteobacteria bacterium]|nr:transposase [Deltaproteobacteria bacterium]